MGRRTYGVVPSNSGTSNSNNNESKSEPKIIYCEPADTTSDDVDYNEIANIVKERKAERRIGTVSIVLGVLFVIAVLIGGITYLLKNVVDVGNGAKTPEDAAIGYVLSIANNDPNYISYLPCDIRDYGYAADIYGMSDLKLYDEKYDVQLSDVSAVINASKLDIAQLHDNLFTFYGKDIDIDDAKLLSLSATMTYVVDGQTVSSELQFNMISIKSNYKWYVYTGDFPSEANSESSDEAATPSDSEATPGDVSIEDDVTTDESGVGEEEEGFEVIGEDDVIDYVEPVVREEVEIEIYDGALADLESGVVTINDVEYVFPALYSDMTSLYTLADDAIEDDIRSVAPNYILKNLPIVFANEDYGMTEFNISIANPTEENIDVSEGIVTTFYVGIPKSELDYNAYDYPYVYLPGNITLTSTYEEVISVYGELEEYTGDNESLHLYSDTVTVYQVELYENVHNHVYLEFENDVLVAIQWHFYDLNAF